MQWIALRWLPEVDPATGAPSPGEDVAAETLGWWALRYTPRVAWLDEALVMEVSACERLWGGRHALMRRMGIEHPASGHRLQQARGDTGLVALARLRMFAAGRRPPADLPAGLPLGTLSAAREHLDVLARMGCRTWGDVAALPRGGLSRRFGTALREALDAAWGLRPECHTWLVLPDTFEQKLELPALAENASELMWSAGRLLAALQVWLRARQRGVLAVELEWTFDMRRYDGVDLPPTQAVAVRTAEPTQDMAHLRRLMGERLALTRLAAPASWLRLRSLETSHWAGASTSFLPDDSRKGDKLHELIERLSARLGPQQVRVPVPHADHRPECMQSWRPALRARGDAAAAVAARACRPDAVFPAWLLRDPPRLETRDGHPWYFGPLSLLAGPQRQEGGWWIDEAIGKPGGQPAMRDYYIAESPQAGLVWVFHEKEHWFLQGIYA